MIIAVPSYNLCMRISRILALAGSLGCCLAAVPVSPSPEPPLYQMIRGQYEDKIRRYSPPEKIFNVFSIRNENDQYVLSLNGILQAICFYNYSESTDEHLQSFDPKGIKQLLGREKDFQIYDYFAFARFLSFDQQKVFTFMQERGLSEIDKTAFKELMLNQICADYDSHIRQNIGIESRQFRPTKEDFLKTVMRSAESMFHRRESYSLPEFIDFRRGLMKELYSYEFKCFKADQQAIDGVDFARSIVKYAQNNQKRKLLRRVKLIEPGIESVKVSEKEYVDFHFELQANMKPLVETLQAEGAITRQEIGTLLRGKDDRISEGQVEVMFRLLDTDDSGFIEKREVLGVIESLGYYWNVKSGEQTLQQLLETRWNNLCTKIRKIHEILMEE